MRRDSGSPWQPRGRTPFALRASLWAVDHLRVPIRWLGVDFALFRLILEQRLRLGASAAGAQSGVQLPGGSGMALAMGMLLVGGLLPGILAIATHEPLWWMLSGQALWCFTLATLAATHWASVLVDPTDVGVLASRPVDDRTLFATRIAQVLADVLLLGACAAALPVLFGLFAFAPLAVLVAYPLATLCSALIVLGAVTLAIALVLRLAGPARFQRVVFWGQVGAAMFLIASPQLLTPLLAGARLSDILQHQRWLGFVFPPLAEHSLFQVIRGAGQRLDFVLAALVLIAPLVLALLTLRSASRSFVAALDDPGTRFASRSRGFAQGFFARLGPRVCTDAQARATFGLTLALSRRDRLYLRSVLPVTAMLLVVSLMMLLPRHGRGPDIEVAPMSLYYVLMLGALTFETSRLSEHARAREWRRILPVASVAALLEGCAKALVCGTVVPMLLLVSAVQLAVFGPRVLPDLALGIPLAMAAVTLAAKSFLRTLPFTEGARSNVSLDRLPRFLALMAAMVLLIAVHALARQHRIAHALTTLAALLLLRHGWRGLAHWGLRGSKARAWQEQEEDDDEEEAGASEPAG